MNIIIYVTNIYTRIMKEKYLHLVKTIREQSFIIQYSTHYIQSSILFEEHRKWLLQRRPISWLMHNQEKFVLFLWLLLLVFAGQKYYLMYPYTVIHINLQKIVRRTFLPKLDHSLSYIWINYSFHLQNELCAFI